MWVVVCCCLVLASFLGSCFSPSRCYLCLTSWGLFLHMWSLAFGCSIKRISMDISGPFLIRTLSHKFLLCQLPSTQQERCGLVDHSYSAGWEASSELRARATARSYCLFCFSQRPYFCAASVQSLKTVISYILPIFTTIYGRMAGQAPVTPSWSKVEVWEMGNWNRFLKNR